MRHGHRVAAVLLALMCITACATAQDDVEYRWEIGAGVGATTYYGDFNSSVVKNLQPAGEVILRKVINPYSAVRIAGMYTKAKGSYKDVSTHYPALEDAGYEFSNSIGDLSVTYEYNFWAYGTGKDYRGAKRVAPFISLGIGLTYANCKNGMTDYSASESASSSTSAVTASIPVGFGVKYRIKDRLNLSLDWQMHFTMSDQLDGVKDPYYVTSSGIFKNTDCFSTLTLALTYSFSAKCPTCMRDR